MTKREFRRGRPDGPPGAWLLDGLGVTCLPGFTFCCEEHRGEWVSVSVPMGVGVLRGPIPYSVAGEVCEWCGERLFE